jgi:hypothetical protein
MCISRQLEARIVCYVDVTCGSCLKIRGAKISDFEFDYVGRHFEITRENKGKSETIWEEEDTSLSVTRNLDSRTLIVCS